MLKIFLSKLLIIFCFAALQGQQLYELESGEAPAPPKNGHLKMGNAGHPAILVNSQYLSIGDQAKIPVMGEIHYSRVPRERWEEYILKMKSNGITIIASYVLWIHHEEIEGVFDWKDNKNLRDFVQLCHKHGLYFIARIGPWCHAEVRNGGTPDWIQKKPGLKDRSNDPAYLEYAKRWYTAISYQLEGLYYKDGGPIIGIQLENEYRRGTGGDAHILWLKQTALDLGMDVPMYTVTGWGNASVPKNEVIPLYGGYPTSPWTTNIKPLGGNSNFQFEKAVNDPSIGNESGSMDLPRVDLSGYPYFTCELGVGNQISYHRRPIIDPLDGVTIAMAKIGSGSNLPGYYVFAGGSNPKGKLTSLEEDQYETGYWNAYPKVSYDFQAAIKESGELAPSYHHVKLLHYFLEEYGEILAPMWPVIYPGNKPEEGLQLAMRTNGLGAFIFGLNYHRYFPREEIKDASFSIKLDDELITFPSKAVDIAADQNFIWPVNLPLGGKLLKYATCQPLGKVATKKGFLWIFKQNGSIPVEIFFDATSDEKKKNIPNSLEPGLDIALEWSDGKGKLHQVLVLPDSLARQSWIINDRFYISEAELYENNGELNILTTKGKTEILTLKDQKLDGLKRRKGPGIFNSYTVELRTVKSNFELNESSLFDNAGRIKTSVKNISSRTELYHHFLQKSFALENSSDIKSARLTYQSNQNFKLRVNERWVKQESITEASASMDLTGYLEKGENTLTFDFPFTKVESGITFSLEIEYYNTDRDLLLSDSTWLSASSYTIPKAGSPLRNTVQAKIAPSAKSYQNPDHTKQYKLGIHYENASYLHAMILDINYQGDVAELREGTQLIADNYYNGTTWSTNLTDRCKAGSSHELELKIVPLKDDYKIFFNEDALPVEPGKVNIEDIRLVPVYRVVAGIKD